jgi:N6-adenosine-specific RNA methylase IME4
MTLDQIAALRPNGGFRAIYCDPPWRFDLFSAKGEGKSPQGHYACMSIADIKRMPVRALAASDAMLFMWATFPMLPEAMEVIQAWGFAYKTGAAWAKEGKASGDLDSDDPEHRFSFGTGYIFRSACELLLVGSVGRPALKREPGSRSIRNLIYAPLREHSRKPESVVDMIESIMGGPYLELFARSTRPGWSVMGDETSKFAEAGA